jgi:hypothetical protein
MSLALGNPVTLDDPSGLCANPDYCPPQIGFGTTATHSNQFVEQIDETGNDFASAHYLYRLCKSAAGREQGPEDLEVIAVHEASIE